MIEKIQITAFERYLWYIFRSFFIFITTVLVFRFFIFSVGVVNGPSMEPNFKDENIFYINRFILLMRPPRRGDIVQVIDPKEKKLIIKRVVGVPNDILTIKRGKVYIEAPGGPEFELDETKYLAADVYTDIPESYQKRTFELGPNQYFVLGDNRRVSVDSRYYGPILRSQIVGKIFK